MLKPTLNIFLITGGGGDDFDYLAKAAEGSGCDSFYTVFTKFFTAFPDRFVKIFPLFEVSVNSF